MRFAPGLTPRSLEESSVEAIKRVGQQNKPKRMRQNVHNEVIVYFKDVATRDMIQSYAPNLAEHRGKAGLRLEVPCHLTGCFKCLEKYGHIMKKDHPDLKWHIHFDDVELSLKINLKLGDSTGWDRVDFATAREAVRLADRQSVDAFRGRLTSSQSSSNQDPLDDEVMEIENNGPSLPTSATLEKFRGKRKTPWGNDK